MGVAELSLSLWLHSCSHCHLICGMIIRALRGRGLVLGGSGRRIFLPLVQTGVRPLSWFIKVLDVHDGPFRVCELIFLSIHLCSLLLRFLLQLTPCCAFTHMAAGAGWGFSKGDKALRFGNGFDHRSRMHCWTVVCWTGLRGTEDCIEVAVCELFAGGTRCHAKGRQPQSTSSHLRETRLNGKQQGSD